MREVIDGLQFARSASETGGTLGPAQLPRLAEMGCGIANIAFGVRGGMNRQAKPCLTVRACGTLQLICQRCLGPLPFPVSVDVELVLTASPMEIERADDQVDRVLASSSMDVAAMVEDELILALPISPKHDSCSMAKDGEANGRASSFGMLERLKRPQ